MPLAIGGIQAALGATGLDGWLLYDFRGSNQIATRLAQLDGSTKMATRRWFYLVPRSGEPRALVHAIERHNLDHLPGSKTVYSDRASLEAGLRTLLTDCATVAMEYSPLCNIPYVSRVDAGTVELVRSCGVQVASSGDLVQEFEAAWNSYHLMMHRLASERLYRIKDRTFEEIARRIRDKIGTTEYDIQDMMARWMEDDGLLFDARPVVAAQKNAGNPHYAPTLDHNRLINRDEVVQLDLWGKMSHQGSVYADIAWVGYTGKTVPTEIERAFYAVCRARDTVVKMLDEAVRTKRPVRGFEVDRTARGVLVDEGYEAHILHRTGHSLGHEVHGNGVHMDDSETHDDRRILPGTGFTIEPGLYFPTFGIRCEINLYVDDYQLSVSGPMQHEIVRLV